MATDMYGLSTEDLQAYRPTLDRCFGFKMELHESSYVAGEEYLLVTISSDENFQLQKNYDQWENDWAEEEFKDWPTILYVNAGTTRRADEIKVILLREVEGIAFLQREVFSKEERLFRRFKVVDNREVLVLEKQLEPERKPSGD